MKPNFTCPGCEADQLKAVIRDLTLHINLDFVDNCGNYGYAEDFEFYGGTTVRYQCSECGYVPRDKDGAIITDAKALYEWIVEREKGKEEVSPPCLTIVYDPNLVTPEEYRALVDALDRLVVAHGGLGMKLIEPRNPK